MCLLTTQLVPYIASEDIPVWKVLNTDNTAYYQSKYTFKHGENYPLGEEQENTSCCGPYVSRAISGGWLHAYNTEIMNRKKISRLLIMPRSQKFRCVKMYIPKGTKYYVSYDNNELCAKCLYWPPLGFGKKKNKEEKICV